MQKTTYLLHDSIYVKCPEKTYVYKQKVDQQLPGAGGRNKLTANGREASLGMMKMF